MRFLADEVVRLVRDQGDRLKESFVVVQPGRVRVTDPRPPR